MITWGWESGKRWGFGVVFIVGDVGRCIRGGGADRGGAVVKLVHHGRRETREKTVEIVQRNT